MSAVAKLLDLARRHDIELVSKGQSVTMRAPAPPPPEVVAILQAHRDEIRAALTRQPANDPWDAHDYQTFFEERAAIAEYDGGCSALEAERTAYRHIFINALSTYDADNTRTERS